MKKLIGNSFIFTISNVLLQAFTFLLLPFYSNIITTSEYGILNTINNVIFLCNIVLSLRIDSAISRFYFECNTQLEVKHLFSKVNYLLFFLTTLGYSVLLVISFFICNNNNIYLFYAILIAVMTKYFDNFYALVYEYLVAKQEAKIVSTITIVTGIINLFSTYFCVTRFENKIIGYLLSFLLVSFIRFLIYLCYARKLLIRIKNWTNIKLYIRYALNFMPMILSYWVINASDRIIITLISGSAAAGIYSMGSNFGHIVSIFIDSTTKVYVPFFYSQLGKNKEKETINKLVQYFISGVTVLTAGVIVFIPVIMKLLNESYFKSIDIAIILSISTFFYGISQAYNPICGYFLDCMPKRTKLIFACAILNILLNIVLVNKMGAIGAAIATMICYMIIAIGIYFITHNKWRVYISKINIIKIILITLIYIIFTFYPNGILGIGIKIIGSILYVLLIIHFCILDIRKWKGLFKNGKKTIGLH